MRIQIILTLALALLSSSVGYASYTTATITSNELQSDGRTRLVVRFAGDSGEPARERELIVTGGTTALAVRQWRDRQIAELNAASTVATAATAQVGQTIPAAPAATPPTQAELDKASWEAKAQRLMRLEALGALPAGALLDAREALRADVAATYQAGYLADF